MEKLVSSVIEAFKKRRSAEPDVVSAAPGRVNLIGEHTDHSGGYVLPVAIDRTIVFAAKKENGSEINGWSTDFDEEAACSVGDYDRSHPSEWFRYVLGVLSELENAGRFIGGFSFTVGGDIPIGAGLSSSAAFETAVLTAMEGLYGFHMNDTEAALLCQRAENNFVGMNCGIMDQLISRAGRKDHAVFMNCTDLSTKSVILHTPGFSWVVVDSKKRRGLVDSEYNKRRSECEEALAVVRSIFPDRNIVNLRDVTLDDLPLLKNSLSNTVYRRLKHVVSENDRVLRAVAVLEEGNIDTVGALLYESHASMRDDFEISCREIDNLVEIISAVEGVSGARMTGGGFGGCVITLVQTQAVPDLERAIQRYYHPESLPMNTKAEIWPIIVSDGAHLL